MFYREDKKRVPVGFIPGGSGNDLSTTLLITNIDKALDYIVKGDTIKIDCMKINLDYESRE